MAHIATDVGASLLRGTADAAPPARAARVSCPAVPAPTHLDRASAAPPPAERPRRRPRSSGGELPQHPFHDPRGCDCDPNQGRAASPHGQLWHQSPADDGGADLSALAHAIQKKHRAFMEAMSAREGQLGIIRAFWEKGDVRACMAAVHRSEDPGLAVDVFRLMRTRDRPHHFRLNMCPPTAAAVQMCLRAKSDTAAMVGLSFLELVLRGFAKDIRAGCAFEERDRGPVDIQGEQRRQQCREARDAFVEVLPDIRVIAGGEAGQPRALQERAGSVAGMIDRMVR